MERQFFAVTSDMVEALNGIGITVADHTLYLTVTTRGAIRIVPVRQANADGEQNEYARTKEIGLLQGMDEWVRLFTDHENHCYKVFPAPAGRFSDPQWPELKEAKIFRLAFRDKGGSSIARSTRCSRSGRPVTPTELPFDEIWLMILSSFRSQENVRMSSASQRGSCARGGRSGCGVTSLMSLADNRRTVPTAACCSSASLPMLSARATVARLAVTGERPRSQPSVSKSHERSLDAGG